MVEEKAMTMHSSTLAWKIPWMEEPGRLQSMGSQRIGHDWATDFTFAFHFHALEKEMATHSSILAWEFPWTEEPGGLQSMGSQRIGHDWVTNAFTFFTFNAGDPGLIPVSGRSPGKGNGCAFQYSCPENSMDRGAWQSTVHRVAKNRTWLSN